MSALVSLPRGFLPYSFLWEILFATIIAVSLLLAVTYPSFGKRWIFFLLIVGVAEFEFSYSNYLAAGMIIGLVTAFSGFVIPVLYLAKLRLRKTKVKIILILSGCLELIVAAVGFLNQVFLYFQGAILFIGLITIGFYSLTVGTASLFSAKPREQPLLTAAVSQPQLKKRSRSFYVVLVAAVLLSVEIVGVVIFEFYNSAHPSYGPGPVYIEVTTDKPVYLQGEEVNFTITVNNPQDWPVTTPFFVGTTIEKDGFSIYSPSVFIDYAMPIPTFPAHSRTLYSPPLPAWNQTVYLNGTLVQVQPGNYTLTVTLSGYHYDDSANCTFEIRQNQQH